ncbi:MAG: hypothetical protein QW648_03005 [Nanoarchaeales archaeon]
MGVERAIVIVILTFIGLLIMLFLILYYYRASVRRVNILNISEKTDEILSISLPAILYSKRFFLKNKKANTISFFIFLLLAILVIIAMVMIYYLIYRGIISYRIEEKAEEVLNKNI